MSDCEFLTHCPFFNDQLESMPGTATLYKRTMCKGTPESCARYMVRVRLGKGSVPRDLFPNDEARAQDLLQ